MKHRIGAFLMLSLMLSMLFIPLAVSADDGKSIIKGMVQAPADYSVGINHYDYVIWALLGRGYLNYWDAYHRYAVYMPDWVFWRLPSP